MTLPTLLFAFGIALAYAGGCAVAYRMGRESGHELGYRLGFQTGSDRHWLDENVTHGRRRCVRCGRFMDVAGRDARRN